MRNIKKVRFHQVRKYGWIDSKSISEQDSAPRWLVYFDILSCFIKYGVWSNQYKENGFWSLGKEDRKSLGKTLGEQNRKVDSQKQIQMNDIDSWLKDYYENRKFIDRYSKYHWETSSRLRKKRLKAYTKRYNMGKDCKIQYAVELCREHFLNGTIKIGNKVLLAKHVFIDYSGEVIIKDNVQLMNGVVVESHFHPWHSDYHDTKEAKPTSITIEEGAAIGSRAIILASCHHIGKNARIGAGAVVTKDIPDNSVAVGAPAKVIRTIDN